MRLRPRRLPPSATISFPQTRYASALAEMRASGAYDHDVARGVAMRVGDASQGRVVLESRINRD